MTGWLGDFFRVWWALFYWNTRKTWFRLRGAHRDDCPCQTYSDSGHAMDSRCEAILGTRCSVELWSEDKARGEAAISSVFYDMKRIDRLMSTW